jgi:glycosyltransferase involved in cell wall biosynthesis
MRKICLVTNYNYEQFLQECLDSLVSQTLKFDQIIIVDDGSTDDSRQILRRFCQSCDYALTIEKENGGQLSCFNRALEFIKHDDYIFFMDSDDIFPHDYLEQISSFISKGNADFIFVNPVHFKDRERTLDTAKIAPEKTFAFSSTSALTRKMRCFIGAETSCVCMKGSLYQTLFPYPYEKDWITQADDVFTFGASIVGAHKLYIESLGISYRIHADNNFVGKQITPGELTDWRLRLERMFRWYSDKAMLPLRAPLKSVILEAVLIPKSIRKRFRILSPAIVWLVDFNFLLPIISFLFKKKP